MSRPFWESIKEFPTSCGDVAWRAVDKIQTLLTLFRERNWPVLYPYVSPKANFDSGRLSDKVPAIMNIEAKGYEFVAEVAPRPNESCCPRSIPVHFLARHSPAISSTCAPTPSS